MQRPTLVAARARRWRLRQIMAALAVVCAGYACADAARTRPAVGTADGSTPSAPAPTFDELQNATYVGLDDRLGPVTLVNGRWTGAPSAPGAASRPVVQVAGDLRVVGDLDGDRLEEAVVVLSYTPGGTASLSFVAVVARQNGILRNVATTALGDRVQVRAARIENGRLHVSGVRVGATDPACCPGELVDWQWGLGQGRLNALGAATTGRLSPSTLGETVWVLRAWDVNEPAGAEPVVTLGFDSGRFVGGSGCNRYFASVQSGAMPGEVKVGPVGGTRMACPEPQSSVEARFLQQLASARSFGFLAGRLAISYTRGEGSSGTMLFEGNAALKEP